MNKISFFTFLFLLASCVGVIKDKNPKQTQGAGINQETTEFQGLKAVKPISQDKIAITFSPAVGNPQDLSYLIFINGADLPQKVTGEALEQDAQGNYNYNIIDLKAATKYEIQVSVINSKTGVKSKNDPKLATTTFSNKTCNFTGVTALNVPLGIQGQTKINVGWTKAQAEGSLLAKGESDPVQYIVYYLDANKGSSDDLTDLTHPDIKFKKIPQTISGQIPSDSNITIDALIPDTNYLVMTRCLHKGYSQYAATNPTYQVEKNTKVMKVKTFASTSAFNFTSGVLLQTPDGINGETSINVSWSSASGAFLNYRVYYKKVGNDDALQTDMDAKPDEIDDTYLDNPIATFLSVTNPNSINETVSGLDKYSHYQFKVVACKDAVCDGPNRLTSSLARARITPKIAPFGGIDKLGHPTSIYPCSFDVAKNCGSVNATFQSPIIKLGLVTDLELHCAADFTGNSSVKFPRDRSAINSPAHKCHNLKYDLIDTPDWSKLTKIEIKDIELDNANTAYETLNFFIKTKLSYGPNPALPLYEKIGTSVVIKKIRPRIKVPSSEEFEGIQACTVDSLNKRITLNWTPPTGGFYTGYEVIYREYDGTSFSYTKGQTIPTPAGYFKTAFIPSGTTSYILDDASPSVTLEAGKTYEIGVLSSNNTNAYSEANSGILKCKIELPKANFTEWTDIFAIGPKENGLIPEAFSNKPKMILETLDSDGTPIEIPEPLDIANLQTRYPASELNLTTIIYDGAFGTTNGLPYSNGSNQKGNFSRNGIIKIAWKDVKLSTGQNLSAVGNEASQTGYKVYRSTDHAVSWVELTSSDYSFNDADKLVDANPVYDNTLNNKVLSRISVATFTDYSVKASKRKGEVSRGRIYYYKIVPIFKGHELLWNNATAQNIIKVILPPENMAYVSRLMANKIGCTQVNRIPGETDYNDNIITAWDVNNHYTCPYNGMGSRSLSFPWKTDSMVYDIGGDLLIDRFELGCNVTRTSHSGASQRRGCYPVGSPITPSVASEAEYMKFQNGDCYSDDAVDLLNTANLADPTKCIETGGNPVDPGRYYYIFPGVDTVLSSNITSPRGCSTANSLNYNFFTNLYNSYALRSDFLAVSDTRRARHDRNFSTSFTALPGAANTTINVAPSYNQSTCQLNFSYNKNGTAQNLPRWISATEIATITRTQVPANANLNFSSTVAEVKQNTIIYDQTSGAGNIENASDDSYALPGKDTKTLGRILSSNASKLNPLMGLDQKEAYQICQTYKVDIGIEDDEVDDSFASVRPGSPLKKRLLRRNEFIVASNWNTNYHKDRIQAASEEPTVIRTAENTITEIERGEFTNQIMGAGQNTACHSRQRTQSGVQGPAGGVTVISTNASTSETDSNVRRQIQTGSSFFNSQLYDPLSPVVNNINTQKCISRFGIQDMIGNVAEYTSDRIFCNTANEKMVLVDGANNEIDYPDTDARFNTNVFTNGKKGGVKITKIDPGNNDSGACSIVHRGSISSVNGIDGITILPTFLSGGLNSFVTLSANEFLDPGAVDTFRNGDGGFLSFGANEIATPLKYNDALALQISADLSSSSYTVRDDKLSTRKYNSPGSDNRNYKYFSPIVGLPFNCNDTNTCGDSRDNKLTTTYKTTLDMGSIPPGLIDIPINNSQIYTDGISEHRQIAGSTYNSSSGAISGVTHNVHLNTLTPTAVQFNSLTGPINDPDLAPANSGIYVYATDGISGADANTNGRYDTISSFNFSTARAEWFVSRNGILSFVNGGGYDDEFTGRYSTHIIGNQKEGVGTRCSVLIKD